MIRGHSSRHCAYYGWVGCGNVCANGHPNGGRWRQLQCVACQSYFLETHGTPLHGKRVAPELVVWAVGALAEGLGIRAVAGGMATGDPVDGFVVPATRREVHRPDHGFRDRNAATRDNQDVLGHGSSLVLAWPHRTLPVW
jgi:hypothetical protein